MNLNVINDYDTQIIKTTAYLYHKALREKTTDKKSILFIASPWNCDKNVLDIAKKDDFDDVIILANSVEEADFFESQSGRQVLFCNNNACIDDEMFKPIPDTVKLYDLVLNNRFDKFKNVGIASLVPNSVHIGYYTGDHNCNYVHPKFGRYVNFPNDTADGTYLFDPKDFVFMDGTTVNGLNTTLSNTNGTINS